MKQDIQEALDQYWSWIRDKTRLRETNDWTEITTPLLDRHNDCLQIYAKRKEDGFVLTDDGYILEDLELSGCKIESPTRQELFRATISGFGVELIGNALEVQTSKDDFGLQKHNLLQAMLAVNDLFVLASPTISSLFLEDVIAWLDLHDIRYIPRVNYIGKSGLNHRFDIAIPKSKAHPERVLRVINRPDKDSATGIAFAWIDTKEARNQDSRAYAILNDDERKIPDSIFTVMHSYDIHTVCWSSREESVEELAA